MKLQKQKIIFVDVDGTICDNEQLPDFDDQPMDYTKATARPERIKYINELFDEGHYITYWTARGCRSGLDHTELTKNQLLEWGCKYHDLQVGNKPHFDMYICDKSWNSESFFHYKERHLP
jgi:hydroxymethylpyrimidine pyrophosphatase-like HAD family hydrolase